MHLRKHLNIAYQQFIVQEICSNIIIFANQCGLKMNIVVHSGPAIVGFVGNSSLISSAIFGKTLDHIYQLTLLGIYYLPSNPIIM